MLVGGQGDAFWKRDYLGEDSVILLGGVGPTKVKYHVRKLLLEEENSTRLE